MFHCLVPPLLKPSEQITRHHIRIAAPAKLIPNVLIRQPATKWIQVIEHSSAFCFFYFIEPEETNHEEAKQSRQRPQLPNRGSAIRIDAAQRPPGERPAGGD